jgi:Acetyltransferase (GNAT) family
VIRRQLKHRRNRRQEDPSNQQSPPFLEFTFGDPTGASPSITITFEDPYQLARTLADGGFAGWTFSSTGPPSSVVIVNPTQLQFNFGTNPTAGTVIIVPPNDPTIRTAQGGYVTPGIYAGTWAMIFLPDSAELVGTVRLATAGDVPFLDQLQDKFAHQLGYLPRQALEVNAVRGNVWVGFENGQAAGYVLGKSPYKGREDVAIIYQSALEYDAQRKSIGTQLVEAWVGSLPKSVRQVICWCAQDIEANRFW